MEKKKTNVALALVFMIFGFLVMLQVKSVYVNNKTALSGEALRANELSEKLLKEKEKSDSLASRIETYKEELDKYRSEASNSGDYAKVLASQLEKTEILAGITAVTGSGVIVQIRDSEQKTILGTQENNYVVHDSDILEIINELRAAGAEALSLNGERLISTSEIRCAGSTVSVNNNRYGAPFEVRAIGDPQTLENALKMRGGVVDNLAYWGIAVEVEKKENIQINGYNGKISFKYATAVSKEVKQ